MMAPAAIANAAAVGRQKNSRHLRRNAKRECSTSICQTHLLMVSLWWSNSTVQYYHHLKHVAVCTFYYNDVHFSFGRNGRFGPDVRIKYRIAGIFCVPFENFCIPHSFCENNGSRILLMYYFSLSKKKHTKIKVVTII